MSFDPSETYVLLRTDGNAEQVPGGETFWSMPPQDLDGCGHAWLISEFECSADWPNWEMHPNGDEFVYLLSGSATLLFEQPGGVEEVPLDGRRAVVVPKGIWHSAKVSSPSRMLFVTKGLGTQHRASHAVSQP